MKILIIDNYDSFTYNLVHMIRAHTDSTVDIFRNDAIALEACGEYDKIVLSPGPGIPCEAGIMPDIICRYAATHSILGVCLGHQAIAECFGGTLRNMDSVQHGVASNISVIAADPLFDGLGAEFMAGRYHSWVVERQGFSDCLEVTATDAQGEIMALRHREYDLRGVQFHPESVLTPEGATIINNWLNNNNKQ